MQDIKLSYILVLIYMAVIFCLSSISFRLPEEIERIDPTNFFLHMAEYSILGFLLQSATKKFDTSFLIGSFYGLSDEVHQYFVPLRTFGLFDLLADIIGSFLGIVIFIYLNKRILRAHSSVW